MLSLRFPPTSLEAALEEKEAAWREVQEAMQAAEDKLVASIQENSQMQVKTFQKAKRGLSN